MNINRDNYEMYFLLYVDKELSAEERNIVEKFIVENPDLEKELELLLATSLPAEAITYKAKVDLYKVEMNPDELKEKILMHLDNELDASFIASVESEIASNEALKLEWNILQQTRLDPNEIIIFENKELLYRHEKDNVVSMRSWRRVAVAAAIIGAGLFIGISLFIKDKQPEAIAVKEQNQQPSPKNAPPAKTNTGTEQKNISGSQTTEEIANSKQQTPNNNTVKENNDQYQPSSRKENMVLNPTNNKNNSPIKNKIVSPSDQRNNIQNALVKKGDNNLPKPSLENINDPKSNKPVSPSVQDIVGSPDKRNQVNEDKEAIVKTAIQEPKKILEDSPLTETHNSYAKNTVMDESASEINDNSILFMKEEKVNRSKIGGLFRKVKRVISRNANIKGGNSVKIAGFEIAAK